MTVHLVAATETDLALLFNGFSGRLVAQGFLGKVVVFAYIDLHTSN
jgi:hypothetical protein